MNLKDQILAIPKASRLEPVPVPEWGGITVYVPVLTLADAKDLQDIEGGNHAALAAYVIRDEQGNRVFSSEEAEALKDKSLAAVMRIIRVYNKLNGHGEDAGKN